MIRRFLTVGGFTLLSRITGFIRDVVMAAVLGAGPIADAFFVAFRLPNHFRAIFAEGAFAAAFVPAYARTLTQDGKAAARSFADRLALAMIVLQVVLRREGYDVGTARQFAYKHAALVADLLRRHVFVAVGRAVHGVHMHPPLMRKGARADKRLVRPVV